MGYNSVADSVLCFCIVMLVLPCTWRNKDWYNKSTGKFFGNFIVFSSSFASDQHDQLQWPVSGRLIRFSDSKIGWEAMKLLHGPDKPKAVWSPHFKFLVFKMESVQRFFTKRLQGMWRQGYDDRLRLLNTHSLEYRRLYSDLVLCLQLLSNSFNS